MVLAVSTLVLVLTGLPAFAAATLTSGATAEPGATGHQVTMRLDPGPSATLQVQVTPPEGFVVEGCQPPEGWTCGVEGRTATYRSLLGELGPFGLVLTVPSKPGGYAITVRQGHATDEAATWTPVLTVASPEPPPEPTEDPAGDTGDGGDGGDEARNATDPDPGTSPSPSRTPSSTGRAGGTDEVADSPTADTPRRTRGRSTGSSFEVAPRRTAPSEAAAEVPAVDAPAVASPSLANEDDPTGEDDDATTVAAGDGTGGSGDTGGAGWSPSLPSLPWQQWVGALLLLTGAVVLVTRQWGQQVVGMGTAVVARLRGVGSATLRRLPRPGGG